MTSTHSAHKDNKKRNLFKTQTLAWFLVSWGTAYIVTHGITVFVCNDLPLFTNVNILCMQIGSAALSNLIRLIENGEMIAFGLTLIPLGGNIVKLIFNKNLKEGEQAVQIREATDQD